MKNGLKTKWNSFEGKTRDPFNTSNVVQRGLYSYRQRYSSSQIQYVVRFVSPQQIVTTVMTIIVVDKNKDNAEPQARFAFYHNIQLNVKENVFRVWPRLRHFLVSWLVERHVDASSVVWQFSQSDCEITSNRRKTNTEEK